MDTVITAPRAPRKRMNKWVKLAIWVIAVAIVICVGLSIYIGWTLTHPEHQQVAGTPADNGLAYENIEFTSRNDNILLKGWYMPAPEPNGKMIIFAHGYAKSRNHIDNEMYTTDLAERYVTNGYSFITFDFRNSGESEGTLTSVGLYEEDDLLGAVDWAKAQGYESIILHGLSMGASTALMAAADEPGIQAVIADSPFNHLKKYLEQNLPVWSHLPSFPFTPLILNLMPVVLGFDVNDVDPIRAVDNIYPRPVLFIHSEADDKIPYMQSVEMADKHPDAFELWLTTKGAGHTESFQFEPDEYWNRVEQFLNKLP